MSVEQIEAQVNTQLAAVELVFTATARLSPGARHAARRLASNSLKYHDNEVFERTERAGWLDLFSVRFPAYRHPSMRGGAIEALARYGYTESRTSRSSEVP